MYYSLRNETRLQAFGMDEGDGGGPERNRAWASNTDVVQSWTKEDIEFFHVYAVSKWDLGPFILSILGQIELLHHIYISV